MTTIFAEHKTFNREVRQSILRLKTQDKLFNSHDKQPVTEVILKPEILDTSKVKEGKGSISFRPTTLEQMVGQDKAKGRVICYLKGCKKFNDKFPNTFLSAPAGCGKTIFANIIANMLGKKFVSCTAGEIKSEQQLVDKIVECEGGILFIDEIHRLSRKVGTFMLPILEEYKIAGKYIKPFICMGATTHKGDLSQYLEALLQRFNLDIELEHYTDDELVKILKQYNKKQYPDEIVNEDTLFDIAKNCRVTPRLALSLLKEYIYIEDIDQVKNNNNIIQDGLTNNDMKLLQYLVDMDGAGKNNIAKFLRVEPKTYEFGIEPYLMYKELISVGNKRKVTNKGKEILKCL